MHFVSDLRGYVRLGALGGIAVHLLRVLRLRGVPLCTLHVFYVLRWLRSIATFDFQHVLSHILDGAGGVMLCIFYVFSAVM